LAGQGTTGLEILEQVPDVDAVIIPTGGGGLLAGCAVALKTMKPSVKIIVSSGRICVTDFLMSGSQMPIFQATT
jgi:threonine dehydratase